MFKRIRDNETATPEVKAHQEDGLRHMIAYCENDVDCRRVQVLQYFDQPITKAECALRCDNCSDNVETYEQDITDQARCAISIAINLTRGHAAPLNKTTLVGKIFAEVKSNNGGAKLTKAKIERLVGHLFVEGHFRSEPYQIGQNFHTKVQVSRISYIAL